MSRDLKSLQADVDAVSGLDKSFSAQNFVAWYYTEIGDADQALPFAQRSVSLSPACWECIDTLARVASMKGRKAEALSLERRSIAAYPHGMAPKELLDALSKYEAAAGAPREFH